MTGLGHDQLIVNDLRVSFHRMQTYRCSTVITGTFDGYIPHPSNPHSLPTTLMMPSVTRSGDRARGSIREPAPSTLHV
jgi:hypothetical protein